MDRPPWCDQKQYLPTGSNVGGEVVNSLSSVTPRDCSENAVYCVCSIIVVYLAYSCRHCFRLPVLRLPLFHTEQSEFIHAVLYSTSSR